MLALSLFEMNYENVLPCNKHKTQATACFLVEYKLLITSRLCIFDIRGGLLVGSGDTHQLV